MDIIFILQKDENPVVKCVWDRNHWVMLLTQRNRLHRVMMSPTSTRHRTSAGQLGASFPPVRVSMAESSWRWL